MLFEEKDQTHLITVLFMGPVKDPLSIKKSSWIMGLVS